MAEASTNVGVRSILRRRAVPILTAITLASFFVAAYFAGQTHALRETEQASRDVSNPLGLTLPKMEAAAAVSSEKFSMATGLISDRAEGLFVLDHNSGLLQCSVVYPRVGQFLGLFTANVKDTLGTAKGGQYMMATGLVDAQQSSNNPVASSVVYVLEVNSGKYACYYIPFNQALMNARRAQQGSLMLLAVGSADPVVDRDALR